MVFDRIENVDLYRDLSPMLRKGLEYIANTNFDDLLPGKYEIEGDQIYMMVNEYETKHAEECKLESHLKYIDIQLILEGEEQVGYTMKKDHVPSVPYDPEKDVMFFDEHVCYFKFYPGQFVIFFPTDLHQPGINLKRVHNVRKVVLKVAV